MTKETLSSYIWTNIKKLTRNSAVSREINELQLNEDVIHDPKDTATALNVYFIDSVKKKNETGLRSSSIAMPLNTEALIFDINW